MLILAVQLSMRPNICVTPKIRYIINNRELVELSMSMLKMLLREHMMLQNLILKRVNYMWKTITRQSMLVATLFILFSVII